MKKYLFHALSIITGLIFVNAGANKFFNYMPMPDDLPEQVIEMGMAFMEIPWLMPFIAVFELIGGILLLHPQSRALGMLVLLPILSGILVHHFSLGMGVLMPLLLGLVLVWIAIENRWKFRDLFRRYPPPGHA